MKRNKFNLSYTKLLSMNMGSLIPIGLTEVLPGDSFQHSTRWLLRCSPLLAPPMHPVQVRVHHWFVPHRLVWNEFEDFITGGPQGISIPTFPHFVGSPAGIAVGSLLDYYGLPTGNTTAQFSVLPSRGYALIWNEFYRDQDLETKISFPLTSGLDTTSVSIEVQNVSWEKDYYTSSRPFEQKGPAITLPLGSSAPVNQVAANTAGTPASQWIAMVQNSNTPQGAGAISVVGGAGGVTGPSGPLQFRIPAGNLVVDLSTATAANVNAVRAAMALQRFAEARGRYGSKFTDYLAYLGVRSSDARLQRPEYLGGGTQTIQFSEVLQTGPGASSQVGDMKGHGISAGRSNRYRRFFEEHGFVHTLMSVRPKTIYMNGIPRHFNRSTRNHYWQRELEGIGQQEIANSEVYAAHTSPTGRFGFQDRYDEYRRSESSVAGEFRGTLLNYWHFARDFSSEPALNASFVKCVPTERTFAVPSQDVLYVMAKHSLVARRLLARTGSSYIF